MNTQDFINALYDLIAQNPIAGVYGLKGAEHDHLTSIVDHVDTEKNYIAFKSANGKEYRLQLIDEYAPSEAVAKSD